VLARRKMVEFAGTVGRYDADADDDCVPTSLLFQERPRDLHNQSQRRVAALGARCGLATVSPDAAFQFVGQGEALRVVFAFLAQPGDSLFARSRRFRIFSGVGNGRVEGVVNLID
jgi:hypothetical protein